MQAHSSPLRDAEWLDVSPGRALRFSPDWQDEGVSVLFDANSGDYWVLTALARALVKQVGAAGPSRLDLLLADEDVTAAAGEDGYKDEQTEAVLVQLVELGILSRHDAAGRPDYPSRKPPD